MRFALLVTSHSGISVRDQVEDVEDEDLDPLEPAEREALNAKQFSRAMNFVVAGLKKLVPTNGRTKKKPRKVR